MIKKISHVAVIVPELDDSMKFWVEALGLPLSHVEHVPEQDVDVAFLPAGESDIELLEPLSEESGVARFLQKKGPGIHHICFEVDDIVETLERLKNAGIPLIDETPKVGTGGKKIAFIHPKGTGGVLVELYELSPEEPRRRLDALNDMRMRLEAGTRVYARGARQFVSALWGGGNGKAENGQS